MKRLVAALIEQIQEDLPQHTLTDIIFSMFADIITTKDKLDHRVTMALTARDIQTLGAVWQDELLFTNICSEMTGRLLHEQYGELAGMIAHSVEDLMAIAGACVNYHQAAVRGAAAKLAAKFPDRTIDPAKAAAAVDTSAELLTAALEHLIEAVQELEDGEPASAANDSHVFAAPSTLQ